MLRRALAIFVEKKGPAHSDAIRARSSLAANLARQRRLEDATEEYRRCLRDARSRTPEDRPDVSDAEQVLGQNLSRLGKMAEAQPHLEEAYRIRQKTLGPAHPRTALSISWLAGNLHAL